MLAHTGRARRVRSPGSAALAARTHGIALRLLEDEAAELGARPCPTSRWSQPAPRQPPAASSSSSSAATARSCAPPSWLATAGTPLLGVNLGHVGFLAEAESDDVEHHHRRDRRPALHRRGAADHRRRRSTAARRAGLPRPGRSTRPASRRPPASGCSRSSSRSTAARCRAGAATASCARRRPGRRPTTSAPAARSSGRASRRC